jgi:hypothetical protein
MAEAAVKQEYPKALYNAQHECKTARDAAHHEAEFPAPEWREHPHWCDDDAPKADDAETGEAVSTDDVPKKRTRKPKADDAE